MSALPLRGEWQPRIMFDLLDRPDVRPSPSAEIVYATPDYSRTMGIRLLAGRFLTEDDTIAGGGAIVSESIARQVWPGASPIGARVSTGSSERVIVGVVNDVRGTALDDVQQPQIYTPLVGPSQVTIVARSPLPSAQALAHLRAAVSRVDPSQVVYQTETMQQVADAAIAEQRATRTIASVFGVATLLLAAIGLYGLLTVDVVRRMPELGVRCALGAQRSQVAAAVVGSGLRLTVVGALVGLATATALLRILQSPLGDVAVMDRTVFVAVPAVLLLTALVAIALPAVRASRVDPMRILRAN